MQRALSYGYYFYPGTYMIDFELAVHNIIRTLFPDCIIKDCLFHFSQALWRKLQEVGLSKSHRNNGEVKEWFRLFSGLPFVPVPHIFKAFQLIVCNYQPNSVPQEAVFKFNSYFERTWIMGNFRLEVWNHFRSDVRSNNICEGYNYKSRLARRAKRSHLNTYNRQDLFRLHVKEERSMRR